MPLIFGVAGKTFYRPGGAAPAAAAAKSQICAKEGDKKINRGRPL